MFTRAMWSTTSTWLKGYGKPANEEGGEFDPMTPFYIYYTTKV